MQVVEDRSFGTLMPIMKKFVKPDTTITSDFLKDYESFEREEGYRHLTVNHPLSRTWRPEPVRILLKACDN